MHFIFYQYLFNTTLKKKMEENEIVKFYLTRSGYLNKIENKHNFQVAENAHTIYNTQDVFILAMVYRIRCISTDTCQCAAV